VDANGLFPACLGGCKADVHALKLRTKPSIGGVGHVKGGNGNEFIEPQEAVKSEK
jgi:hypothetical protein